MADMLPKWTESTVSRRVLLAGGAALLGRVFLTSSESRANSTVNVEPLLEKHKVPGLCMARIEEGKPLAAEAYGLRSLQENLPAEAGTVFEAASLSKPVFASAVIRLRDRGVINLDTPLTQYLEPPFPIDDPRIHKVTARMALSHSSGLPHGRDEGEEMRFRFEPGTRFLYSSTGLDYLQRVAEHITGHTLAEIVKAEVFAPLGMATSSFDWQPSFETTRAQGYDSSGEPGITPNERFRTGTAQWRDYVRQHLPEIPYPNASAGMFTTAGDYVLFVAAMMNSADNTDWLAPASLNEMAQRAVKINRESGWGLGWGVMNSENGPVIWHWGNWGVFQHFTAGMIESKRGVVILTNSGNGLNLCRELVTELLGLNLRPIRGFLE